jgi:hypothetical protein
MYIEPDEAGRSRNHSGYFIGPLDIPPALTMQLVSRIDTELIRKGLGFDRLDFARVIFKSICAACTRIEDLGEAVATPAEARQLLKLKNYG